MILPLYSAIEKLDGRLLEAARDLGANAVQRFFRVILPLTMPGIVAVSYTHLDVYKRQVQPFK